MYNNGHLIYKKPLNYKEEWSELFKDDFKFQTVNLTTRKLKHVFVNHYGLVLKNGLLVRGCAPNIGCSKYDKGFYYTHWRKGIEQLLVCKYGKSLTFKKLPADKD